MTSSQSALAFESFGAKIGIRTAGLLPADWKVGLPPRSVPISDQECDTVYLVRSHPSRDPSVETRYELFRNGTSVGSSPSINEVRTEIESDIHFRVALHARRYVFVHAGVVQWEGRAIVVPGRSLSGKSSLIMALTRAGAEYFSDEFAVLDPEGRVHSYAKALSERRAGMRPLLHPAESLGTQPHTPAVPIGLTVITSFRNGATWAPRQVSAGRALMALFENTVKARSQPEFTLDVLKRAVAGTLGVEGERGDASEVAAAILDRL
jgi:hypothetical protein